jgi:hypothetical protein
MRVASLRCTFTLDSVRETPDLQGAFTLWDANECVYVGHTRWNTSLRDCLRECLALRDEGVIDASHFAWETTSIAKTREADLLALCITKHGKLPRYNREDSPMGPPRGCVTDLRARG